MITRSKSIPVSFPTITTAGFATAIAQIIVLRELLVLFYGNEMTTGLIFACWLLWTALGSALSGRWSVRFPPSETVLGFILILLAAMLPLLVFLIRGARVMWFIPAGELPSLGKMLIISVTVTGIFCPLSGALFGMCWAFHRQRGRINAPGQPLAIFLGEALGAAMGGLVFYYVFFPYLPALAVVLVTSAIVLAISGWVIRPWQLSPRRRTLSLIWFLVSLLVVLGGVFGSDLEKTGRLWQWGKNLVAVCETPYHNIAIAKKSGQVTVFANGLWLFSTPDKLSAEHAVHPALLQHPGPKTILLLSGGIAGHLKEILKHPQIKRIDYVEPDPDLIPCTEKYLSPALRKSLRGNRVRLFHQDASMFMRRSTGRYEVILMNMGDPVTAQMNRFYTKEFFEKAKQRLLPGGVFSFAVSGGEDMMGRAQARFIGSLQKTLGLVFPNVLIYPGDRARFVATDMAGKVSSDFRTLTDRMNERNLKLTYIREDTLQDTLSPFRLDYLKSVLDEFQEIPLNSDFSPICYFHNLMLWATQWHPLLEKYFTALTAIQPGRFWAILAIAGAVFLAFFWTGRLRFRAAVAVSVLTAGAVGMVLQVIFLLTFQILEGFVYLQLALIIAFFMAGLGLGAGWVSWWEQKRPEALPAARYFIRIQALTGLFPLLLVLVFSLIHGDLRRLLSSTTMGWIFSGLSLTAGILGGIHFSLAVLTIALWGSPSEKIGGGLYALDLTGAAGGVLIASFFVLPVYGLINTLILLSVLSFLCFLALLRHP